MSLYTSNEYGYIDFNYPDTTIKDYYRYYLLKEIDGSYCIKNEKIPLNVSKENIIISYHKIPDDYSHLPYHTDMGKIKEGWLWLEEDNIEKAAEIFKESYQKEVDHYYNEIDKLQKIINMRKESIQKIEKFITLNKETDDLEKE